MATTSTVAGPNSSAQVKKTKKGKRRGMFLKYSYYFLSHSESLLSDLFATGVIKANPSTTAADSEFMIVSIRTLRRCKSTVVFNIRKKYFRW